jgi:hypothetical protein
MRAADSETFWSPVPVSQQTIAWGSAVEQCLFALKTRFEVGGTGRSIPKFAPEICCPEYQEGCQHKTKRCNDCHPIQNCPPADSGIGRLCNA